MTPSKQLLAFDFGASSGRAMLGRFDGERIDLEEIHRFPNDPVQVGDTLHWDVLRLFHEIKQGLIKAKGFGPIDSFGIDTWGVDFGLLDRDGRLLENPVHYRDTRTQGVMDQVFQVIPKDILYQRTGTQFLHFNTLYQLFALSRKRPELLERAGGMLLMPDLFLYLLTGRRQAEFTIASTGQMVNPYTGDWDRDLIEKLDLPVGLLSPIVHPGQIVGSLSGQICAELGVDPIPAVAVTSHDTASAVVAVPAAQDDFVYISSGTWSLMGIESPVPLITDQTYAFNFTNEGGYNRTTRFLKNIMGLWLIQESRRQWNREGANVSYADLEREALDCKPFGSLIDPDADVLGFPGDMPERIRALCRETGQAVPEKRGEVVRCIYESLALKYRVTKDQIESVTGRRYPTLHVVGGGTKDGLLSQFTANATGSQVVAGPIEATALGNMAVQLLAQGVLKNLAEARQVIARSFALKKYQPEDQAAWQDALKRYRAIYPTLK
ncbi:MAG: rhamnulokinase [Eubacteriales bacterium]|nr:rhamnulokinase [Clostridiales bacterium]MDD4138928.1 rhamnulokinase [Eubacteriales bacterium]MDD4743097.1 rhamnulokinase [Eubacteriales bacterium]